MIAYIKGVLGDFDEEGIVVESSGVGYYIQVPADVLSSVPSIGSEIKVYTYLQVREDAMCLFGFLTKDDLEMFKKCISVTGVGPKAAISLLSEFDADSLRIAIMSSDVKAISKANGIGKKTAERLILELKDKVTVDEEMLLRPVGNTKIVATNLSDSKKEAVEALTALGYGASEALKAVNKVENADELDVETLLKTSLKYIF